MNEGNNGDEGTRQWLHHEASINCISDRIRDAVGRNQALDEIVGFDRQPIRIAQGPNDRRATTLEISDQVAAR